MSGSDSRSFRELLDALARTAPRSETQRPEEFRQRIYQELADSEDPLLREVGEQLRDGVLRPHQLLDIPGYDTLVHERLDQLARVEPDALRTEIANYLDAAERAGDTEQ